MPEGTAWVDFLTFWLHFYTSTVLHFVCSVALFEAAVLKLLKNAIYISSLHFVLLNKRNKLWPRQRNSRLWPKLWTERHSLSVDLRFERLITVYKHWRVCQTHVYHSQIFFCISSPSLHETHPNAIDTGKSLIGNDFTDTNDFGEIIERLSLKTGNLH